LKSRIAVKTAITNKKKVICDERENAISQLSSDDRQAHEKCTEPDGDVQYNEWQAEKRKGD
jgi:hypothetical protein